MGKVVGVVNQKGGVGKTTLAVHLAVALARAGKDVLVVDGDPQGNATSWLCDGDTTDAGLFRLLVQGDPHATVIRPLGRWGLALLPGNGRTAEAMIFLAATGRPFETIGNVLRPIAMLVDYVVIDMPPSRAAGFEQMLFACDGVIVPTQLERLAMEGVGLMAALCTQMEVNRGHGPQLLGVVPNMVRFTNEHQAQLENLTQTFGGVVWPPVPLSVRVSEAASFGEVLFDFAPEEKVTAAVNLVISRFQELMR